MDELHNVHYGQADLPHTVQEHGKITYILWETFSLFTNCKSSY